MHAEHQDSAARRRRLDLNPRQHFQPIHGPQPEIEYDELRIMCANQRHDFVAIGRFMNIGEALGLQNDPNGRAHYWMIIDDQR
jgi:hypothetical protein